MTDQTAQEPTMEEILASIRRIISEDDAPAETAQAAAPEVAPAYEPEPEPVDVSPAMMDETPSTQDEDVLELTDRYEEPAAETIGDLDVTPSAPEPVQAPEPEPFPAAAAAAAGAAASAFAGLTAAVRKPAEPDLPAGAGTSLEALVGSLLRPMLKEWLDANLPAIVETQVRKEVERIARNAG
jgi:uncharacterized protein